MQSLSSCTSFPTDSLMKFIMLVKERLKADRCIPVVIVVTGLSSSLRVFSTVLVALENSGGVVMAQPWSSTSSSCCSGNKWFVMTRFGLSFMISDVIGNGGVCFKPHRKIFRLKSLHNNALLLCKFFSTLVQVFHHF